MFRLIAWLALLAALNRPPDLEGKATFYHRRFEDRLTRTEEVFRQDGLTAAVEDSMWPELRNKKLLVCGKGRCVLVRANDTGYLAEHGIVVDLSKRAFSQLGDLERGIIPVKVWVIEEER